MLYRFFVSIGFVCLWIGCGKPAAPNGVTSDSVLKGTDNDSLYRLVGYKHDEVMPKDSEIESAIILLGQLAPQAPDKDSIYSILGRLRRAHEGMTNWMREFKALDLYEPEYKNMTREQIRDYLLEEERRIDDIAHQMLTSLEAANKRLAR